MHRSYGTSQDSSWEPSDSEGAEERPGTLRVLLTGVFCLVGGGLLGCGPYLSFGDGNGGAKEIDLVAFPTPLLLVVLAGLVAVAGLGAILFSRRPFGAALAGLSIAPGATAVAFQAPRVLDAVLSSDGRGSLRIGGWLVTAGTVVVAVAALLAFVVTVSRLAGRRGVTLPLLGGVATAGLLQWWLVSPVGRNGDPGLRYLIVDAGGSVWPGVTALGALALVVAAVAVASARCGAGAVGTTLGAALAVGLELGARFTIGKAFLRRDFDGDLRGVPIVLTGITAAVLLALAIGLAVATSRRAAEAAEELALRQASADHSGGAAEWDQPNPTDPWTTDSGSAASASGVWGSPEATGAGRSWSSSETSSTRWPST